MNDYKILIIENIDQFNKNFNNFYELSLSGDISNGIHVIGLDCEYISNSSHPESYNNADWCINKNEFIIACKLQLATKNICMVIDLCKIGKNLPGNLITLLKSESWIKCGVGISGDMDLLSYQYNLGNCNGVFNASLLCKFCGFSNPNLENLYNIFSKNQDVFKKQDVKNRDWSQDMSLTQIKYACEDAIASHAIGTELLVNLKNSVSSLQNKNMIKNENKMESAIEIMVSNENYIGKLLEYAQKNKFKQPQFDFDLDSSKNFYCVCKFESNNKEICFRSDGFPNKKECKQDVCKKILENLD